MLKDWGQQCACIAEWVTLSASQLPAVASSQIMQMHQQFPPGRNALPMRR